MKRFWLFTLLMALSAAILTAPTVVRAADDEEINEGMGILSRRLGDVETTLKMKFSGDIRVRGEYFYQDTDPIYNNGQIRDRYRTRVRARFNATKAISEEVSAYMSLATGLVMFGSVTLTEPTSTNQTLTGDGSSKNFSLDKAAIEYSPNFLSNKLTLVGGKITNPLEYSAITWDGDVNPEGFGIKANPTADTKFSFLYFVLQENSGAYEAYLASAQLSQGFKLGDFDCSLLVGGEVVPDVINNAHAQYPGTGPKNGMVGDTTNVAKTIPDMVIAEAMLSVKHAIGEEKIPVAWTFHGACNTNTFNITNLTVPAITSSPTYVPGKSMSNALALLAKVGVGKADQGMWAAGLEFGMIEPNATYGLFTDSDSGPGYNNNTWIKGTLTLGVAKDMTFGITQYADWHTNYEVFGNTYNSGLGGTGRKPLFRSQIDAIVKL